MIVGNEAGGGSVGLDGLRHFGFFLIGWLNINFRISNWIILSQRI